MSPDVCEPTKETVVAKQSDIWAGGCLCGTVTYKSTKSPLKENSGYCHCRLCQKAYGNGFATFVGFPVESFKITSGQPKTYKSSNVGERSFCANCGSPVTMRYSSLPNRVWVYVGTLERTSETERFMESHVCAESEIPWLTVQDGLPRERSDENVTYASAGLNVEEHKPE